METENLTEKENLSLMILMGIMDLSPDEREEFRELVRAQAPTAVKLVDVAISMVEETEMKAKIK